MKLSAFIRIVIFPSVFFFIILATGCSNGNLFLDKFVGIWIADTTVYYDYARFKWDTIPTDQLPADLFTDRHIRVLKIEKISSEKNTYDATVSEYSLNAINRPSGNYIEQLEELQRHDNRKLMGYNDPAATTRENTLFLKDPHKTTLVFNVKEGKKTKEKRVDARARFIFEYDDKNDTLKLKQYYYETEDGQKISVPPNDKGNIMGNLKRYDNNSFQKFCNDLWSKSFSIAEQMK